MSDVVITKVSEPDQTVVVHVDHDVVALFVFFPPRQELGEPDEIVYLGAEGAEQLGCALVHAAMYALDASWRAHRCMGSASGSACDAS